MRTQLLVFSFCISLTFCLNATTYLSKNANWNQVDTQFSNFYLKNGTAINFILQKEEVYFPKCCPPYYQYEPFDHKCVKAYNYSPIYEYLNLEVNLIGNKMQECEVVVDHVLLNSEFLELVHFLQTTLILQGENYFQLGQYCLDTDLSERIILRLCYDKDYCVKPKSHYKRCIKKCCPDGYHYYKNKCTLNPTIGLNISDHEDVIKNVYDEFVIWYNKGQCLKYLAEKSKFRFSVEENGSFFVRELGNMKEYKIDEMMYCIEELETQDKSRVVFLLCGISNQDRIEFQISRPIMIISFVFLILTIVLLLIRPQSRNLMDKVVISYCFVLACAYIILTLNQFQINIGSCTFMGYSTYFLFIATFTWMNVLCFDIWRSFRLRGHLKFIFLKYNIYAWLIPIVLTVLILIFNYHLPLPDNIHPFVGTSQCLLENRLQNDSYGFLIFFLLPSSLSIIFNTICFVICLRIILKRTKEIRNLERKEHQKSGTSKVLTIDRQRVFNGVALFLIMGLSWSFEIIASIINFKTNKALKSIEIFFDTLNALQGVIIFLIIHYALILRIIKKCSCKNHKSLEEYSLQQELSMDEKKEMVSHKTNDENLPN